MDTEIRDVSDTSFWVAHYRALETMRPDALFRDPFATILSGERGRRISNSMPQISRYAQWAVVSRTVIIDRFIEMLVREGVDAVINLGAGLDARPYRMDLPAKLEWIEADFMNIIAYKTEMLRNETPKCRLSRIPVDLSSDEKRRDFLRNVVPDRRKVLILSEGIVPYLTEDQVENLGRDLRKEDRFQFWIAEYFDPRSYRYLNTTVRSAKMKNSPFRFFPSDWMGFFKSMGWSEREIKYSGEIAKVFGRVPPMPWFARLLWPILPVKVREQSSRMTGYVIFQRS